MEHDALQVESASRERVCFSFSGAFNAYTKPWGGQSQQIAI
jgi:hypothetical protein